MRQFLELPVSVPWPELVPGDEVFFVRGRRAGEPSWAVGQGWVRRCWDGPERVVTLMLQGGGEVQLCTGLGDRFLVVGHAGR